MLHEAKEPDTVVLDRLHEALPSRALLLQIDGVALNTLMSELALFGGEPLGGEREVWQDEAAHDGDDEGDDALEDEEPLGRRSVRSTLVALRWGR